MQEKDISQIADVKNKITEAVEMLDRQRALKLRNLWLSSFLRIGQYVIGAILVTAFFQDALSAQGVGFLGLVVLLSTILQQRLHPDVKVINAKTRVLKLTRVIRTAEAGFKALQGKDKDAPDALTTIKNISEVLSEVERSQHLDYALMRRTIGSRFAKPVADNGIRN
jgi:hypothetical protein